MFQTASIPNCVLDFRNSNFEIVSDFDIRIWNLGNNPSLEVCWLKL